MVSTTNEEVVNEVSAVEVNAAAPAEIRAITEEDFEKAQKTFQQGKKNLFLNKYDESVNNFDEACKVFASKYGEMDAQCGEVYFFYGRALLELARVENTVLGNALNGVPEESGPIDDSRYGNPDELPADEKKEISEQVIDALCNNDEEKPATTDAIVTDAVAPTTTEEASVVPTEPSTTIETPAPVAETTEEVKNGTEPEASAEGEEEEGDDEEDDEEEEADEDLAKNDEQVKDEAEAEEISNLQRSWEMFELAKLVYTKNFDNDPSFKNKRVAECLLKLGEISIEQELYEQSITDISESIRLQEEQKEQRDDRMLAESYYQLGLAQQFNNLFVESTDSYQRAINIMQLKIEKLRGRLTLIEADTSADAELERNTVKDEITELEALLPDLTSKLEEVTEQGQQSLNAIKEAKEYLLNGTTPAPCEPIVNGNGEIKDITSLVKSKRKISATEDVSSLKKTRLSGADEPTATEDVTETSVEKIAIDETTAPVAETCEPIETA